MRRGRSIQTRKRALAGMCLAMLVACRPNVGFGEPPPAETPTVTSVVDAREGNAPAAEPPLPNLLGDELLRIDLGAALRLAGEQNSQVLLAQQRVLESVALRQLAAAQFLPTLNGGSNLNSHWGNLQQSNGNILSVNREALYAGAGSFAVGSGTVNVPGVVLVGNVSETVYQYLQSAREVDRRGFAGRAVEQDNMLGAAVAYLELLRAEGQLGVTEQSARDAREVARLTAAYAQTGAGRNADADRAATELKRREAAQIDAQGRVLTASARLCRVLHMDPSVRLHAADEYVLPSAIVPDLIPITELLAVGVLNRPELQERRVAFAQAVLNLEGARLLAFSPTIYLGYSAGLFGGGSNLTAAPAGSNPFALDQSRFGNFDDRQDFDAMAYWTLRNLGVGNKARIDAAASRVRQSDLEQLSMLDRVNAEIAAGFARAHARLARIRTCELAVRSAIEGFQEDLRRVMGQQGLPLEVLNSLRLLAQSRAEYLDAIIDFNIAEFELYVALGKPAADALIREGQPAPDFDPGVPPQPAAESDDPGIRQTSFREPEKSEPKRAAVKEPIGDPSSGLVYEAVVPPLPETSPIDLGTALHLAEAQNPTIASSREAIREAMALRLAARGALLPTLNAGAMYHLHQGPLQASTGEIRTLTEQSAYFGGGAWAVGAGTVMVPAVRLFGHLGDAYYAPLVAQQVVGVRSADSRAVANTVLLEVIRRYLDLLRNETSLHATRSSETDLQQIVSATAAFAKTGQGRAGDYQRSRTQALLLRSREERIQEGVATASAILVRTLHLDPSVRLTTGEPSIGLVQLVDAGYRVDELIGMAQSARPEVTARSAELSASEYRLRQECVRPWLPVLSVGFSAAGFGGGSNRADLGVDSRWQHTGGRADFDVYAVWSLQNMGLGNAALQSERRAERDEASARRRLWLSRIAREVADAYANVEASRQQLETARSRLRTAAQGAREEITRTRGGEGLPLEANNSVQLLVEAREALITALIAYNFSQFELFVAVGQTPDASISDPVQAGPAKKIDGKLRPVEIAY